MNSGNNQHEKGMYNLIVILGPTASGKTSVAARLAYDLDSEIISADSRQVFRGMDIGTGKELDEYTVDGKVIPYHLIDIVEPTHEFSLFEYQRRFFEVFEKLSEKGIIPIMAGGTGLYIESVLKGYEMTEVKRDEALRRELEKVDIETLVERLKKLNPNLHNSTDLKDKSRIIRALEIALFEKEYGKSREKLPEIKPLVIGIRRERNMLKERIAERLKARLKEGLIEEVKSLHNSEVSWERLDLFGLEYRFVGQYLQGKVNGNDMFQKLNSAICKFAKRQETWFRRMERQGIDIHWIDNGDYEKVRGLVTNELAL